MTGGTALFVLYTATGLAITPMLLIKSSPSLSQPAVAAANNEALAINRERQRAMGCRGVERSTPKDRRDLDELRREERKLVRRQRIADEFRHSRYKRFYLKLQAVGRPFKLLFGAMMLLLSLVIVGSMLITAIDKVQHSPCGKRCGYILPNNVNFNPTNWALVAASKVFPVDYILALIIVLLFFVSTVIGITFIGIRFLWVSLFQLRPGATKPQGLLVSTVILTLTVLAINYALTMVLAPQYSHYGGQMYCDRTVRFLPFLLVIPLPPQVWCPRQSHGRHHKIKPHEPHLCPKRKRPKNGKIERDAVYER